VMRLAAAAGIVPWKMTLRQLAEMAEEKEISDWDRAAWISWHGLLPYQKKRMGMDWTDLNPIRRMRRDAELAELGELVKSSGARLPAKLTNEEIRAKWKAMKQEFEKEKSNG